MEDFRSWKPFYAMAKKVIEDKTTLLYYDRLFNLYQFLNSIISLHKRGTPFCLVEVGVYKGGSSYFLADICKRKLDNIKMYAIDTFEGHKLEDLPFGNESVHVLGMFKDTTFDEVSNYLESFQFLTVIKKRVQDEKLAFKMQKINFLHLDVDIFEPTYYSLNFFNKMKAKNCIFVIDDYGFKSCPGVKKAVDLFLLKNKAVFIKIDLPTGQCLLISTKK